MSSSGGQNQSRASQALQTGLGRISSTPIFRNIFSSVRHSDSLTDDFCSSVTDALILPEKPLMDTGGSFDVHQWGPLDTNLLAVFTSGTEASPGLDTVPNNMQLTMNTQTPSHIAVSGQFQSSDLVDHSATSEYAGYSVPRPFPSASTVENFGDQPNGPQPLGYWRSQAQVQAYPASNLPFNPLSGPPPEAASTSRIFTSGQSTNQNELQGDTPPSSLGVGICLERPLCPVDGTVVDARRDACVKIRFDMAEISRSTPTEYAGLKIPCTLSVKNRETTSEHKLLGLQILVFGTISGLQYESICDDCKKKENRPGSLSLIDFHSRSDVVLPLRGSDDRSICISFTFHCYPKHYNNNDSGYRLEVLLYDQERQGSSIVLFRLPYTFNIVAKRTRAQFELEDGGNLPARPRRNTRRKVSRDNVFVRSCSVRPSTQAQQSSGSSGSLDKVGCISSQRNNPTLLPTGAQDRASSAPHAESSRSIRIPLPSATLEGTRDGRDAVIEGTNPGRGPTTGGLDIWIYGSNLPDGSRPLYARFGDNVTRVNVLQPGLLSCKLPSRRDPGKVPVWLSWGPTADAPPFGESLCEFEYFKPLNEIVSTLVRILEVPNPQQVAVLEVLMKEATSSSQEDGSRGQHNQRGGMSDNDIERAIIHALEPLQKLANFGELVSMTNNYNQTLAHFAGLSAYFKLLKRLVEWNIDLTIADVNGLTPLHCAYKGGCGACVELLLDAGASGTVLDAIGRTPAGLMPDSFELLIGALSLDGSTHPIVEKSESHSVTNTKPGRNGEGCYSGNNLSDHGGAYNDRARRISILTLRDAVGIRSDPRHEQEAADSPPKEAEGQLASSPLAENKPVVEITPVTVQQHGHFFDPAPAYPSPVSNEAGMARDQGQYTSKYLPKPTEAEHYKQRYLNRRTLSTPAFSILLTAAAIPHKGRPRTQSLGSGSASSALTSTSTGEQQRSTASNRRYHRRSTSYPFFPAIEECLLATIPWRRPIPTTHDARHDVRFKTQPPKTATHATPADPLRLEKISDYSQLTLMSPNTYCFPPQFPQYHAPPSSLATAQHHHGALDFSRASATPALESTYHRSRTSPSPLTPHSLHPDLTLQDTSYRPLPPNHHQNPLMNLESYHSLFSSPADQLPLPSTSTVPVSLTHSNPASISSSVPPPQYSSRVTAEYPTSLLPAPAPAPAHDNSPRQPNLTSLCHSPSSTPTAPYPYPPNPNPATHHRMHHSLTCFVSWPADDDITSSMPTAHQYDLQPQVTNVFGVLTNGRNHSHNVAHDSATNPHSPYSPFNAPRASSTTSPSLDQPRLHVCVICRAVFHRNHDLKRHEDVHNGTKPYVCKCGRTFTRKDALKRHMFLKSC